MPHSCVDQIKLLLTKVEQCGISSTQLLRDCNHSFTLTDLNDGRIRHLNPVEFARICEYCVVRIREHGSSDPGSLLSRDDVGLLCHAMVTSLTLREAIERKARLFELLNRRHGWITLAESGKDAVLVNHLGEGEKCWERFFLINGYAVMAHLLEWMIGMDLGASIAIEDNEDDELSLIASMFSIPIQFGSRSPGLTFPADRLDRPVVRDGLGMRELLKVYPFDVFLNTAKKVSLSVQVAATYREAIIGGKPVPDMFVLAKSFGMSAATFRRHLDQEGGSVRSIKDGVRHRIAIELLDGGSLHIEEIALKLGFSCAKAFARAFIDWQGSTPTAFQRACRSGQLRRGMALARSFVPPPQRLTAPSALGPT